MGFKQRYNSKILLVLIRTCNVTVAFSHKKKKKILCLKIHKDTGKRVNVKISFSDFSEKCKKNICIDEL